MSTVNTIKEILDQKRDELLKQMQEEIMKLDESSKFKIDPKKHYTFMENGFEITSGPHHSSDDAHEAAKSMNRSRDDGNRHHVMAGHEMIQRHSEHVVRDDNSKERY